MQSVILLKNGQQGMSFGYLKATYSLCNSDCDSIVRRSCGSLWRMPCDLLPVLLDVPSGTPKASLSGSREPSGTKKSLEFRRSAPVQKWPSGQAACSISFLLFVHLSSALYLVTATIRPYRICLPLG